MEGLAGVSHSPAPRGGVTAGRGGAPALREMRVRAGRPSRWLASFLAPWCFGKKKNSP